MPEKRTITLTDRAPVAITADKWPLIASAEDNDFDGQSDFQANRKSKWFLGIRQHKDGRTIVYATYSYATNLQNEHDYRIKHGVFLPTSDETAIIEAMKSVIENVQLEEHYEDDGARWSSIYSACVTADQWMSVGFWSPSVASKILDSSVSSSMAKEHAKDFDTDVIYSMCNGDFSIDEFVSSYFNE